MATNKNAVLRYNTLDKCFSNFGRKYYFEDLVEEVDPLSHQALETSYSVPIIQDYVLEKFRRMY